MKKNSKFIAGIVMIVLGLGLIAGGVFLRPQPHEITRAQLGDLIQQQQIIKGTATPTAYAGIYRVEGTRKIDKGTQQFFVTTHLDEAELKNLFAQNAIKIDMPGQGFRGQWISLLSTVLI